MRPILLWSLLAGLLVGACAVRGPGRLPAGGPGIQSLFRVEASGEEGEARLRLVLRRQDEDRFQLAAADQLGRTVWSLTVDGGRLVFADYRRRLVCRGPASRRLLLPLLGLDLPPGATVRVLLGELPVPLPPTVPGGEGTVRFRDERGQQWEVELDAAGQPRSWRLEGTGGRALASWRRGVEEYELRLPEAGIEVRWRLASTELLPAGWRPAPPPDGFREGECELERVP